ncbi:nuclear transport factor 2 family protein [Collimonas antrihumi]|uniref:nuclear transport factor 2 family protein n=1 Tax=Collimonas antrihumi TaxID=1940615 RepID=UPI001B8BDC4D|nr:nuclear transport factor 2 family protein [Collimonas antrihumi]
MDLNALEARLTRMEDIQAICQLKADYLLCCDRKDPEGMRACFMEGEVVIDYGVVGCFTHRDQLVDVFVRLGCHPHIVEMHHGVNPQIAILEQNLARASWGLHYQQIDTIKKTVTQLGAFYEDEYRKIEGEWKISKTRCNVMSTMVIDIADGAARILFAGGPPAHPVKG